MLAHELVEAEGAAAERCALVLHGVLGSGQNWRSFAKRLAARTPGVRYVLVDLRNHGDSTLPEADPPPPPHTLEACARDLEELAASLSLPVASVIGHSFGGKVALVYAERAADDAESALRTVWSLDSPPGALPPESAEDTDVARVLETLRGIELPIASREALVETLRERGHSLNLARWMTTNLRPSGDAFEWRFDLDGVVELMKDFYRSDCVPFLESVRPPQTVHVVRAGRSDRWPDELWGRLEDASGDSLRLHILEDAGHWLHVDAPDRLLELLADSDP